MGTNAHCLRAGIVTVGLVLATSVAAGGAARAADRLVLTPPHGVAGDVVVGQQEVSGCPIFRLHWGDDAGPVLGQDDGRDGIGAVTFRVPAGSTGAVSVVATCEDPGSAVPGERTVAGAVFAVTGATTTTATVVATTVPGTSPPSTAGGIAGTTTVASSPTTKASPPTTTKTSPPTTTKAAPTTAAGPVPTAAPSPTPTTGQAAGAGPPADIAACERQAREARSQLVYQPSRRMTLADAAEVVVQLALSASDLPGVSIPGPDRTTIVPVRAARCTVEAQLTGVDFEITPAESRAQSFLDSRVLTWQWQVSPKRVGTGLRLVLRLQPTVVEDGKPPRPGSDDFHEALIQVDARPISLIAKVDRSVNGFVGNDLVKLFLLPSGGGMLSLWAAQRYRRRSKERGAPA